MSDENCSGETDGDLPDQTASSADSAERESIDEVPEYEGQWAALSDGNSFDADGDSDEPGDSGADHSDDP
ncbi:hypothetical protein EXE53_13410 [Halorubrum sp. SD626R]|nr:hypothetical protein EXE53_13410 [Halorubrum sp. SD626R]